MSKHEFRLYARLYCYVVNSTSFWFIYCSRITDKSLCLEFIVALQRLDVASLTAEAAYTCSSSYHQLQNLLSSRHGAVNFSALRPTRLQSFLWCHASRHDLKMNNPTIKMSNATWIFLSIWSEHTTTMDPSHHHIICAELSVPVLQLDHKHWSWKIFNVAMLSYKS